MSLYLKGEKASKAIYSVADSVLLKKNITDISLSVAVGELAAINVKYIIGMEQLNTILNAISNENKRMAE